MSDSIFPDKKGYTFGQGDIPGLTKRELFAVMIFAHSSQEWMNSKAYEFEGKAFGDLNKYCAKVAVMRADALLAALESELEKMEGEK